jgi:hypothetical protein
VYLRDHLLLGRNADATVVIVNDEPLNFEEEFRRLAAMAPMPDKGGKRFRERPIFPV